MRVLQGDRLRPLDELDRGALARAGGVLFDVDDTLTCGGVLEREAMSALYRLADAKLTLIAVTGRPLGWSDALAALVPITLAVGENGAGFAARRGHWVESRYVDDDSARLEQRRLLERVTAAVARSLPHVTLASDQPARRADVAFDVGERTKLPKEETARLVELIEQERAHALVSSVHCHAMPARWDKISGALAGLRWLEHGTTEREICSSWIFVGDSGNDRAGFERFELSVGVANVRDHLHALATPPRFVTQAPRGVGFAELADALLEARNSIR